MAATARSPFGTHRQPLGTVADHHAVDDARRVGLEIDHARGVDAAVGRAGAAVVGGQRELAVRRHHDIVGPLAGRQIDLVVGHLVAGDVEHRDLVRRKPRRQRALAVRA